MTVNLLSQAGKLKSALHVLLKNRGSKFSASFIEKPVSKKLINIYRTDFNEVNLWAKIE